MRRIEKLMVPRTAFARRTSRKPGPSLQVQVSNAGQGANIVAKTALDRKADIQCQTKSLANRSRRSDSDRIETINFSLEQIAIRQRHERAQCT